MQTLGRNVYMDNNKANLEHILKEIPDNYQKKAQEEGRVERINYESNSYDSQNKKLEKYALVYLPYGYSEEDLDKKYNVFYLFHGGGDHVGLYFDRENESSVFKRILDNMIEKGDMEPLILVTPTYYPDSTTDPSVDTAEKLTVNFHQELLQDIIPAVESSYHTYAETVDAKVLQASRAHRASGGFSMGSVATWYTFIHGLDYFKYFMPMSGDSWIMGRLGGSAKPEETAEYLDHVARKSRYSTDEYFIYALTGTDDIAFPALNGQIEAMKNHTNSFIYDADFSKGNLYFSLAEGGVHNFHYEIQYIYNALPVFWK